MASSFNANQFDQQFRAPKLCNWEVPKYYPSHPETRRNCTKIIANDRGHLLPGVLKPTNNSPWGGFKGTWQLPDKISRNQANELSSTPPGYSRWKKPSKSKIHTCRRRHKNCEENIQEYKNQAENIENNSAQQENCNHQNPEQLQQLDLQYTPGDLTSPRHQHSSRDILLQQKHDRKCGKDPQFKLNDLYLEAHNCTDLVSNLNDEEKKRREHTSHVLGDDVDEVSTEDIMRKNRYVSEKPGEGRPLSPIVPAFCNFQTAKKMAQENLEHQPLPDAVADRAYRRLQAQGILNPGIALEVIPHVTGIGVKSHKAGPTQCTKLRVFRPKTCGVVPKPLDKSRLTNRPQTSHEHKENMGAMDLAICWDYRPVDPRDEPKPAIHIDGTNDTAGPAVFTLVRTPRSPTKLETGRSGGIFTNTQGEGTFFDKDVVRQYQYQRRKHSMDRLCQCDPVQSIRSVKGVASRTRSSTRDNMDGGDLKSVQKRYKSSPNLSELGQPTNNNGSENVERCYHEDHQCMKPKSAVEKKHRHHNHHHRRRYHSAERPSPKEEQQQPPHNRTPRLCQQQIQISPKDLKLVEKSITIPFRAGIPKSNSSGTCTSFDSGCSTMTTSSMASSSGVQPKIMCIPKPRLPYTKKNYTISTLIPPFACWRGGAGQGGYPEHWRLASVYQHAYKPIDQRKRPLLATVYQ